MSRRRPAGMFMGVVNMTQRRVGKHPALAAPYGTQGPIIMGMDFSTGRDKSALVIVGPKGVELVVDRDEINTKRASRKADREFIACAIIGLMERHGAQVEREDLPPNPGFCGAGISLKFTLNGVGATLDIDDLHGGEYALISWYNATYPARDFAPRFNVAVGDGVGQYRPHHKATTHPRDWYSLAMRLDAGLCLAARGEAFIDPVTT